MNSSISSDTDTGSCPQIMQEITIDESMLNDKPDWLSKKFNKLDDKALEQVFLVGPSVRDLKN